IRAQSELQATLCSGRGFIHPNLTCSCFSGFQGADCSQRACPTGRAWTDFPSAKDVAHADGAECSNMGTCDRSTGTCFCREGFEGPACSRLSCANSCSGHGRCLSMSEAASGWDGRTLVRPNVKYTSIWDADIIHGCVCDIGWMGYDCSQRECPRGDDPLTPGQQNEVMRVVCQADSGSFTLTFRGVTSDNIPFNASYGYVESLLETMTSIGDVSVSILDGNKAVCASDTEVSTEVEFLQTFGDLPAAYIRSVDLELAGGDPTLAMETASTISCPACPSCSGGIYLIYDDEATSSLSPNATAFDIESELRALSTLGGSGSVYGNLTGINVSTGAWPTLCDASSSLTTTIRLRSSYGNLPNFTLVNSVVDNMGQVVGMNFTGPKGTKESTFCSNHGVCNVGTGVCTCDRNTTFFPDEWYWWESSDGYGGPGSRPDCGYQRVVSTTNTTQRCPVGVVFTDQSAPTYETMDQVICSGKGTCNNATGGCDCYPGFYGGDCSQQKCPTGKAWFDEARSDNNAHGYGAECSSMGACDHATGLCTCREGWTGAACQRLTCDDGCGGNGACLPMYRLGELREAAGDADPVAYGINSLVSPFGPSVYSRPEAWDFDMIYGCLCDSMDGHQPRAGKRGYVSGVYTDNERLSGWLGYKCDQRTCPTGDNPLTAPGSFEVQIVSCTSSYGYFTATFRGETTNDIWYNATKDDVKNALEAIPTIGSVSIHFTSGLSACNSSWVDGEGIEVTFLTELGLLPLITTNPVFYVNRTVVGTKDDLECAGNGICDYSTGLCSCLDGWASSDGDGSTGSRGDCGYHNSYCTDNT
ncbi:unnamed protein product, partial [Discosporangium mesarthrocarpum]